jgi:hypothetical protein
MLYAVSLSCECRCDLRAMCDFQDVVSADVVWPDRSLRICMTDKESANCRLEANYAHQQELDMIPLKMTVRTSSACLYGHFRRSDVSAAAVERTAKREKSEAQITEHFSEIFAHLYAFILASFLHTSVLIRRRKASSRRAGSV